MIDGFVESQGAMLHYVANAHKADRTTVLFVPGVMLPAWIWNAQLHHFASHYNVVAMEPRSQGDSQQVTEGHYAFAMAQDIRNVVDALNLKKLILVGWSIAASQVLNYAVHFAKQELVGLVLVDGLVGIDPSVPFFASTVDYWDQLQRNRLEKSKQFVFHDIFKQPQPPAFLEHLLEVALRTPTNTVMTLMSNYILQDFRPLLPRVQVPTLWFTVESLRLEYMKMTHRLIPQCHLEILQHAGHALFVDQAKQFNELLETFIKACA